MSCCENMIYRGPLVVNITIPSPLPTWHTGVYLQLYASMAVCGPDGVPIRVRWEPPYVGTQPFEYSTDIYNVSPEDPNSTPDYYPPNDAAVYDPECDRTAFVTLEAEFTSSTNIRLTFDLTTYFDGDPDDPGDDRNYFAFCPDWEPLPAYPSDWNSPYLHGNYIGLNILGEAPAWQSGVFSSSTSVTYDGITAPAVWDGGAWYQATLGPPIENGYVYRAVPHFSEADGWEVVSCDADPPDEPPEPTVDDDIRLRVWGYSLDNHDNYVLRLGLSETLVYNLTTGQWAQWASPDDTKWRAHVGQNWIGVGPSTIARAFGTDVVAGDDATGVLYILDPTAGQDDEPTSGVPAAFERMVMGGIPLDGREVAQCNAVTLNCALGASLEGATITLETSDDMGQTYVSHGDLELTADDYSAVLEWRSLGIMRSPGRIFRITDTGATVRIGAAALR